MTRFSLLLALMLSLPARAGAQEAGADPEAMELRTALRFRTLDIDGDSEASAGRLVVLDSSSIPATARAWTLLNPPPDDNHQISADGERLFFSTAHPGSYWIVFAFSIDEAPGVVIVPRRLVITGKRPPDDDETDPDEPPDDPEPEIPAGRFGLAELAFREAGKLSSRKRAADVASIHRTVASRISAGTLKGIDAALDYYNQKLKDGLGDDFERWKPWGRAAMGRVLELWKSEKLKSDGDFADALEELADGLDFVK